MIETSFANCEIVTMANYRPNSLDIMVRRTLFQELTGSTSIFPATVDGLKSPNPMVL